MLIRYSTLRSSIPTISGAAEVAVVDLSGLRINARNFVTDATQAPAFKTASADATRIISLWQSLPADEPMRCHIPPFGLRFSVAGVVACQGSICWKCNNIYGESNGSSFCYTFDGTS